MLCVASFALLVGFACLFDQESPQELRRAVPPKSSIVVDPVAHRLDLLVVKFAEGSGVTRAGETFESTAGQSLRSLNKLVKARLVKPLFAGLEPELKQLRRRVLKRTPKGVRPPADLALYFTVETQGIEDMRQVLDALHELPVVELAYPKEKPTRPPGFASRPGDILPVTPSLVSQQGYREVAPDGIDARPMRSLVGAWGEGVTILDIEWGWYFDHEDLARLRPPSLVGPAIANPAFNNHGTAVMGEISGDPDAYGVTGLAPDARLLCATDYPATGYSVARAIVVGVPHLKSGDVMLLEAQTRTPLGLGPTEFIQADFDAIQNATRLGIVTVEAAGNGSANLDHPTFNRMFDLSVRDSGAIIVGATDGKALSTAYFSTYGSRIDANGWGQQVVSTGYGNLWMVSGDRRQNYTAKFNGTSSASPMVTSAVAALLGAARRQLKPAAAAAMDYIEIRRLLRAYGTVLPNNTRPIGKRPDMSAMLVGAGLDRGLRVLDDALLGKTVRLRIEAASAVTSSDFWVLIAAYDTAVVALPPPFVGAGCDLLLLDLANAAVHATGAFLGGSKGGRVHTELVAIPAVSALLHKRLYWQAVTLRSSGLACTSNAAMTYLEN